jgi:hypothetical protein
VLQGTVLTERHPAGGETCRLGLCPPKQACCLIPAVVVADVNLCFSSVHTHTLLLQAQGRQLPILNIDRTAQPNAAMVLAYLLEGAGELEELASSWVKATSGAAGDGVGVCVCM